MDLTTSPHTFHIPVMGTGFTIDTPLKVARFGVNSVVSLVDDVLIDQMRRYHSQLHGEPFEEIPRAAPHSRERRITAYLNLMHTLIQRQIAAMKEAAFTPGSDIVRYFELLPDGALRQAYLKMKASTDLNEKEEIARTLRQQIVPGRIDVNIMTKLDRIPAPHSKEDYTMGDAFSAFRGFAKSNLEAAIVFSAGLHPKLYSYIAEFPDFFPNEQGQLKKQIILKVSDYRSAAIQGKFLAKRGIWVSEFRLESGLNCGGHAFATQGYLMGPILEEFLSKRRELHDELSNVYQAALASQGKLSPDLPIRMTAQGGVGTAAEHAFLLKRYELDSIGWGTPFLLVPEATQVDPEHLHLLTQATEETVKLSGHSPLGVPFWTLTTSASERARLARIEEGAPGTACPKGYLAFHQVGGDKTLCTASKAYQAIKLNEVLNSEADETEKAVACESITQKACICHDLGGGATQNYGIDPRANTAVCCGPNIIYFKHVMRFQELVDHIYGRLSVIDSHVRPHVFLNELVLYLNDFRSVVQRAAQLRTTVQEKALQEYRKNLLEGIAYYHQIADQLGQEKNRFLRTLDRLTAELEAIPVGFQPLLQS